MSHEDQEQKPSWVSGLSEDWLAVVIGLGLVVLVWLGAIASMPWPLFDLLK
jgi:hypothetical protein